MKTTIELPDALLAQAQQHARVHRMTMKALIEQGLRIAMAQDVAKPFKLRDGSFDGGSGMNPELKSWARLRDAIYDPIEGRG